ncbi:hypothetical protein MexAM1_META1p3959 [Methylorubrum extorquens AM1]|uniref:Uncharacterized protein n=1 Tax=Methylorubrum extorquens (strain ATCC 14718 / DSM 1338 / JCM 2805 / NCIMB 9133 / AM1) TaxID=272630 RepID=C5B0Q4_METEA|nr:hypothetical protein MexAM1_META1p3959 [Methylorubrum extorquens AM1]
MLVIAGLGFTARHVSDVLFPSFGEEA